MLLRNFPPTSNRGDWRMPVTLDATRLLGSEPWEATDVVELHLSPDHATWDDYGQRRLDNPPASERIPAPFFATRSDDGRGIVTLAQPSTIVVVVPAWAIASLGIGTVNVGIHYEDLSTGARTTLLAGRLPIVSVA